MVVCDYLSKRVKRYLARNSEKIILTFFKEPFSAYKNCRVVFIDDIMDKADYEKIDRFVNDAIKTAEDIFCRYLNVEGYDLFRYFRLHAKINLGKIYKYKYAVDKISKAEENTKVVLFSQEKVLWEWIKQDYSAPRFVYTGRDLRARVLVWIKSPGFVSYSIGCVASFFFRDHRDTAKDIVWADNYSLNSELMNELKKDFRICLLQNNLLCRLWFAFKGCRHRVLGLKDNSRFNREWNFVKQRYKEGLKKIAGILKLTPRFIETVLMISQNAVKNLVRSLFVLQDNKRDINLLIVHQSVIGHHALLADFSCKENIPSIEILHGVPGIVGVGKTSKICVYGKRDKDFLTKGGVDESKLIITGCPRYDKYFRIREKDKAFEFFLLILDWVQFVPSRMSHRMTFDEVISVLNIIKHLPSEKLVIKLHPGQSRSELKYIKHLVYGAGLQKRAQVKRDADTAALLRKAKIVFTRFSSVGLEAMLVGKFLIRLDFLRDRVIEYEKYGGCIAVNTSNELLNAVSKVSSDIGKYMADNSEKFERTRRYFYEYLDGNSCRRVADLCRRIIASRTKSQKDTA